MESLFRFSFIRPAVNQDPANSSIDLSQNTPFQRDLIEASKSDRPREAMREVALIYVAGPDFISEPSVNPLHLNLVTFARSLDKLEREEEVSHEDVVRAVRKAFDADPDELIRDSVLEVPVMRLKDSILAIKQLQEKHILPIEALVGQLRDLDLIVKVASHDDFPKSVTSLKLYRRRSLRLPDFPALPSVLSTARLEKEWYIKLKEENTKRQNHIQSLVDRYLASVKAIEELTTLGGEYFHTTPETQSNGRSPREELPKETRKPLFKPLPGDEATFRLKSSAHDKLSESTKNILKDKDLDITKTPLDKLVESLKKEITKSRSELDALYAKSPRMIIKRIGDTLVTISTPSSSRWESVLLRGPPYKKLPTLALEDQIPTTRGKVFPSGVSDLMIVKQQLIGYEGADIAHIENILKSEHLIREHVRRQEIEQITFRETEVTKSEERDLQSSSRYEMSQETNTTIKQDSSLKAGLTLSGRYGPSVEFTASAEGAFSRSKEEATKSASSYSQEITERSAAKITERVLLRESLRITTETTEKNLHEFDNKQIGSNHISGVYQWINKIYQAQMFNYGMRTMFDFMIPEPAAFLIEVLKSAKESSIDIEKPEEFTLTPAQIDENTYGDYVKLYGVTDVSPPPEQYIIASHTFKGTESTKEYSHAGEIAIDDGYEAIEGCVVAIFNEKGDPASSSFALGRRVGGGDTPHSWIWTTPLDLETKSIPFALDTFNIDTINFAIEVKCQRTLHLMNKWRHDTHAKITIAYKARLSEYEEKLSALSIQAGVSIEGKNPLFNLETINNELKKNCISIITDQHYDLFDAIELDSAGKFPQIDLPKAQTEGPYVRFFEQAFEWENMTWVGYPYFWGRKGQWQERIVFEDPDPLFNQFLKAGYCRVVVPVRPGFESAIDHFRKYGELWNGGPLPTISSPLYLPVADELAERLDRPGTEIPEGEPWIVKIPTTLVKLRDDDSLPSWVYDEDGKWVES
ncbi:hypothetical protein [Candidatus Nitrosocosmicus oleophilus]|nr:hypothetical protein [Candidatus Nitrosocosmicus oleophilus]